MDYDVYECIQCGRYYVFSDKEEQLYLVKGFDMPLRCPECRRRKTRSSQANDWLHKRDKKRDYRLKYGT
jgi:hypothetical protein